MSALLGDVTGFQGSQEQRQLDHILEDKDRQLGPAYMFLHVIFWSHYATVALPMLLKLEMPGTEWFKETYVSVVLVFTSYALNLQ